MLTKVEENLVCRFIKTIQKEQKCKTPRVVYKAIKSSYMVRQFISRKSRSVSLGC